MQPPRLSHLEAAVSLALEYGAVARDPERVNSEEWYDIVRRRQDFLDYLRALDVDTAVIRKKVDSIPYAMYGPSKYDSPFEPVEPQREDAGEGAQIIPFPVISEVELVPLPELPAASSGAA